MFYNAYKFNGNIGDWDVSSVTNMKSMFKYAYEFNQDIAAWNVSSVTIFIDMFNAATAFNRDLSNWTTSQKYSGNYGTWDSCGMDGYTDHYPDDWED